MDWNPNGTLLAFTQHRKGLYIYNDATDVVTQIFNSGTSKNLFSVDWSPNGKMIAFSI